MPRTHGRRAASPGLCSPAMPRARAWAGRGLWRVGGLAGLAAATGLVLSGAGGPPSDEVAAEGAGEGAGVCRLAMARGADAPEPGRASGAAVVEATIAALHGSLAGLGRSEALQRAGERARERAESGEDLLTVLSSLLEDVGGAVGEDGTSRLWLRAADGRRWSSGGEAAPDNAAARARADAMVDGVSEREGAVVVGRLEDGTLYIRTSASASARGGGSEGVVRAVAAALAGEEPGRAVVIDLRFGAWLSVGDAVALAGLFAEESGVALHARGVEGGEPVAIEVEAGGLGRFEGPVVLLTGAGTDGGAEALVLASMASPRVTRIGEATAGEVAQRRVVRLPNGWRLGVPWARLLAWDQRDFAGTGIPAHVPPGAGGDGGEDPSLRGALDYIERLRRGGLVR